MQPKIYCLKWLSGLVATVLAIGCASTGPQKTTNADPRQNFIMATSVACATAGLKEDRKVRCALNYEGRKPVLQLSFQPSEDAKKYVALVLILVGPDLCAAAKAEKDGAALVLIDTRSNQTSKYSCDQQAFTGWVRISNASSQ